MRLAFMTTLITVCFPAIVAAQDLTVSAGTQLQFAIAPDGKGSANKNDLNAYIEIEKSGLYGGIWAEISNQSAADEVDLYFGYRGEAASGLSYDINYYRFMYPNDGGDCCGELALSLGMPLSDALSGSLDLAYDPEPGVGSAYLGLSYAVNEKLIVSGSYGTYQVEGGGAEQEWDLGISYALGEETSAGMRYYNGTDYTDGYIGLSLNWDTTLLSR